MQEFGQRWSKAALLRDRMLVPDGKGVKGSIVWNSNGRVMSTIGYQSMLREDGNGALPLYWVSGSERRKSDQMISVVATPQHFGGQRWWFLCPVTGRHVMKLYLPNGGGLTFASREAYRLPYRCQQETEIDRANRKRFKLRD